MATCSAEFTIEPFDEGNPGPHVTKSIEAVEALGLEVAVGPFGSAVRGDADAIAEAVGTAVRVGVAEGATRVSITVVNCDAATASAPDHPFFAALAPVLDTIGAASIPPSEMTRADVPIEWDGEVIGGIRLKSLHGAVSRMVDQIVDELGGRLDHLDRDQKQHLVRVLDERGAFLIRGAVEEVAELLDVSRITVYNYLNATSRSPRRRS